MHKIMKKSTKMTQKELLHLISNGFILINKRVSKLSKDMHKLSDIRGKNNEVDIDKIAKAVEYKLKTPQLNTQYNNNTRYGITGIVQSFTKDKVSPEFANKMFDLMRTYRVKSLSITMVPMK